MENIDWNSVPDAEYWCDGRFFKTIDGEWYCAIATDSSWRRAPEASPWDVSWWNRAIERPTESWSGEGLPPVGTMCMIDPNSNHHEYYAHHAGKEVLIVAHDSQDDGQELAVYRIIDDVGSHEYHALTSHSGNFIPIRTPEQIAAEERDASINQMIGFVKDHPVGRHGVHHLAELKIQEEACRDLYDAGYRKGESK